MKKKKEIREVCSPCGVSANVLTCLEKYGMRPMKLAYDVSTFHKGTCDYCERNDDITEVRDFFYPDFTLLDKYKK